MTTFNVVSLLIDVTSMISFAALAYLLSFLRK